jgi:hypothetical protein
MFFGSIPVPLANDSRNCGFLPESSHVLPKIDREQTATTQLASRLYAGKLCVVCEGPLERKSERQRICGKRKCAAKYKANRAYYLLAGRG